MFDVTIGSYDGAEVCKLVGPFFLNNISQKFAGLYCDDGLMIAKTRSRRTADKARSTSTRKRFNNLV